MEDEISLGFVKSKEDIFRKNVGNYVTLFSHTGNSYRGRIIPSDNQGYVVLKPHVISRPSAEGNIYSLLNIILIIDRAAIEAISPTSKKFILEDILVLNNRVLKENSPKQETK
jgi:hypothetical protein